MNTPPVKVLRGPAAVAGDPCLEGCLSGQREPIEQLFHAHRAMVERLIGRLVGPSPDLEDLVQSTFVEVLHNLPRYRGEAKLSTWICGIAVHVAHHHLRAGKVRRHVSLELVSKDFPQLAGALIDPRQSADQNLDGRRVAVKLHTLLDRITAKKRVALLLYVMEDRSVEEIAALMKSTQTATRSRMYFARRELRKLIASDPELRDWAKVLLKRRNAGGEA
jgi:RNA polymerase sigma-70 factor (ECF subfamily)